MLGNVENGHLSHVQLTDLKAIAGPNWQKFRNETLLFSWLHFNASHNADGTNFGTTFGLDQFERATGWKIVAPDIIGYYKVRNGPDGVVEKFSVLQLIDELGKHVDDPNDFIRHLVNTYFC